MDGSTVVVSGSHVMSLCCLGSGRRHFALARISICLGRNLVGLSIVVAGACFVSQVLYVCRRCFRVVVRGPGRRYVSLSDYPSWPQVLSLFPHVVQYDRRYFRFVVRGHGRKHVAVIWDVAVSSYPSWSHVLSFFPAVLKLGHSCSHFAFLGSGRRRVVCCGK